MGYSAAQGRKNEKNNYARLSLRDRRINPHHNFINLTRIFLILPVE